MSSTDSGTGGADAAVATAGSPSSGGSSVPACTAADMTGCLDEVAGTSASDFGNYWRDSWFIMGCPQHDADGHDCVTVPDCPNQAAPDFEDRGAVATETFPLGGKRGTTYAVSFQFNGLSEGEYYQGGQYARPDVDVATPGGPDSSVDEAGVNAGTFYIGGTAMATNYNVMRLRVLDPEQPWHAQLAHLTVTKVLPK